MIYLCSYVGKGQIGNAVIRWWTGRQESHCELLFDGYTYAATIRDGGVRRQAADITLANREHWIVEPVRWINEQQLMRHFGRTRHQTYDWIGLLGSQVFNLGLNNKGASFCSEWIAQAAHIPNPSLYNPGTLRDLSNYLNAVTR